MLRVHITSDERGEGKTVLASFLVDFMNGLGHNVRFESTSHNERLYYPDNEIVVKDIVVSTDNSHLPWRVDDNIGKFPNPRGHGFVISSKDGITPPAAQE